MKNVPLRGVAAPLVIMSLALLWLVTAALGEEDPAPDLEFRAKVKAKELRFEHVTGVHVNFRGSPGRRTVWDVKRKNIPKPVKPGETYHDVEVDVTGTSTFVHFSSPLTPTHEKR